MSIRLPESFDENLPTVFLLLIAGVLLEAVGGVGAVVAAPYVLAGAGFTAGGVASGSLAAGMQSAIYGGATCGAFSALQAAGAAGIGAAGNAAIGAAGAAVANGVRRAVDED